MLPESVLPSSFDEWRHDAKVFSDNLIDNLQGLAREKDITQHVTAEF
ncbi:MAG: hypothetical protein AB7G68_05895 [Nitrospiraceae bacterium]